MKHLLVWSLSIILCLSSFVCLAQDAPSYSRYIYEGSIFYRITTKDGKRHQGKIVYEDDTTVRLQTESGEVSIPKNNIRKQVRIQQPSGTDKKPAPQPEAKPAPQREQPQPAPAPPAPQPAPAPQEVKPAEPAPQQARPATPAPEQRPAAPRPGPAAARPAYRVPVPKPLEYPFPNYYFTSSGYGLRKGEFNYQNTWLVFNNISYGINDFVSIGAGTSPIIFTDAIVPVWATAKISLPIIENSFQLGFSAGAGSAVISGGSATPVVALLSGVATFGPIQRNVSIGVGTLAGFGEGEGAGYIPLLTVSSCIRATRNTYLISENFVLRPVIGSGLAVVSVGARTRIKRIFLTYAVFVPAINDLGGMVPLPYLGINVPFRR
jgi:hypothetical protein